MQHPCPRPNTRLRSYLFDMRCHMPPAHRGFLVALEAGPSVRHAVQRLAATNSAPAAGNGSSSSSTRCRRSSSPAAALVDAYDAAVSELERFRAQHRGFARAYIAQFSDKDSEEVGTGGSAFMLALKGYRETTATHRLGGARA